MSPKCSVFPYRGHQASRLLIWGLYVLSRMGGIHLWNQLEFLENFCFLKILFETLKCFGLCNVFNFWGFFFLSLECFFSEVHLVTLSLCVPLQCPSFWLTVYLCSLTVVLATHPCFFTFYLYYSQQHSAYLYMHICMQSQQHSAYVYTHICMQ